MEKYGVKEEDKKIKNADGAILTKCPVCGAALKQYGNILKCTNCGTDPFERKNGHAK